MTSGFEELGKAYKTKTLNISYMVADMDKKKFPESGSHYNKSFHRANSNFFQN
jgi:hypothetical protein